MNSCLLIIDVQKGFINEYTDHIPKLVENEQNKYKNIYITQFFNPQDSFYRNLIGWNKMEKGSLDFELAFRPSEKSILIQKSQYSLIRPTFLNELKNKSVNSIDICGIDTEVCVLKNAVDLIENNIRPRVLTQLCASTAGQEGHEFGIKSLFRFIGKQQVIE